ncbi:pyridoxamine 5'-phosphate oxidase [bacterium]|nr:pyridoxamine 5'-phosphate oxidase [bacterium]
MLEQFAQLRQDYQNPPLSVDELDLDPLLEFQKWFTLAADREPFEANAMTLATADGSGRPSARVVLLKELDASGFVFFTNYESSKAQDLLQNPRAALVFYWAAQHRQVRVEGSLEKVTPGESDAYFATRPRGAQLGAWASRQSRPIESREEFQKLLAQVELRFPEPTPVPRPEHWGGYRVVPDRIEFWQGQPSRLHDRIEYTRTAQGWARQRLMP